MKKHVPKRQLFLFAFIILFSLTMHGNKWYRWDLMLTSFPLKTSIPPRIVVSMSTFSTRIELTALQSIEDLLIKQPVNRILVTVPLKHRNAEGECILDDCVFADGIHDPSSVKEVLVLFENRFGTFHAVQSEHEFLLAFVNQQAFSCEIYLQFMTIDDFGPATKLLGALYVEKNPETIVVVVDDDALYSENYIWKLATHLPDRAVMGTMSQYATIHSKTEFVNNLINFYPLLEGHATHISGWLMGTAGVAYRVGYFDEGIFHEARQLSRECLLNDDVWLGGYARKLKLDTLMYFGPGPFKHTRHGTKSLSSIVGAQTNDLLSCARQYGFSFFNF
jgi:hypothetical protein